MAKTFYKSLISHLFEVEIERRESHFSKQLIVSLAKGRYQLSSLRAIYSYEDLYLNFAQAFEVIDWEKIEAKNCLLLGLGMGSVFQLLEKHYANPLELIAVDIDPVVIELFSKYIKPQLKNSLNIYEVDAGDWIASNQKPFDIVIVDVFIDDVVPNKFLSVEFLEELQTSMSQEACLFYNLLAMSPLDKEKAKRYFEARFKQVFKKGHIIETKNNYILINDERFLR